MLCVDSSNDGDCGGGGSVADFAAMRSESGNGPRAHLPPRNSSCGRLPSFGRDFTRSGSSKGGLGGYSSSQVQPESVEDSTMPEPVDVWYPPKGDSISIAKVVAGAVLFSCAGGKVLSPMPSRADYCFQHLLFLTDDSILVSCQAACCLLR